MTRALLRFVAWTIKSDETPDAEPITHAMQCRTCGEKSLAFQEIDPAQLWALKHAGRNQEHRNYREVITRPWRAMPAEAEQR